MAPEPVECPHSSQEMAHTLVMTEWSPGHGPGPGPGHRLDTPALVVLVGPSGSGKSTWAANNYLASEIVCSDALRGVVGTGPHDLDASVDAFALLDQIVAARAKRHLTTVIDTLGLDANRRRGYLELARRAGLRAVAVRIDTPAALCRARNSARDRPVPAPALTAQLKKASGVVSELEGEAWDELVVVRTDGVMPEPSSPARTAPSSPAPPAPASPTTPAKELEFVLQLSRFPWGEDPLAWLQDMARAAAEAGFTGIALMDHLIQIPQVGRAWDPIPEPWVTLGSLAGLDLGLKLGTLVSPVTFRAPGIVAKAAATLDVLTGGRAFCGLGAGWWEREHAAFGLPFPGPKERLDQLERTIETLKALWAPGTKAHDGDRVGLPETTCYPRPVGLLPIIVGGSGRRTLSIAARWADGCNLPTDAHLPERIDQLREQCRAAGRDAAQVAVTVLDLPVVAADREQVAAQVEQLRGRTSAATFGRSAGTPRQQIERYRGLAALGVSTVFAAPARLRGPADLKLFGAVTAAFE